MRRTRKYRVITTLERINNRLTRFGLRIGMAPRAFALLETTGRRSGQPRHTPVGNGLDPAVTAAATDFTEAWLANRRLSAHTRGPPITSTSRTRRGSPRQIRWW